MADFTTDLADLVKGANRALVAAQLKYAGSVPGNVAAFKQEVGAIGDRYADKLENLAARGANIGTTRATILTLVKAASDAANVGTVKVPPAA